MPPYALATTQVQTVDAVDEHDPDRLASQQPQGAIDGFAISISIRKSTATRSRKYSAGSPKTESSICGRTQAPCSAISRRSCSPVRPTTGEPRAGWRNWVGCSPSGARADCSSLSAAACGDPDGDRLSLRGKGTRIRGESYRANQFGSWEAAKAEAGVESRFHDLRHTACTRMLETGASLSVVASIMGWSARTTANMAKRYGHIGNGAQRAALDALVQAPTTNGQERKPKANQASDSQRQS
jgi:hypothetical protein